ncbi:class I SAM-dependent methyltransferase [Sporocytophaga myxococcoides]|uniref:class I SAM-dependent methyltransferase n=1 Tax=Sporocytophaga myxococcoides TaxID=153721 RepID=UPI00040806D0|nr:SAM-dependent methyltransferase [Sporocytophaga myxococcoides]
MNKQKNNAIRSAETVAALRAATAKEEDILIQCEDYLAKFFIGFKYRLITSIKPQWLLQKIIEAMSPGSYCFAIIRTKFFDEILLKEISGDIEQVVILGAGYDTRGIRFKIHLKKIKVFEVDFPGTQRNKRKKLVHLPEEIPSNIHFIPLDFNERPFHEALMEAGFSKNKRTLFLWEGVSYYLPEKVVVQVLSFISQCAIGSSIVFDYATKDFVNGDHSTHGGKEIAKWLKKIKEPFLFGLNADEISSFLSKINLSVITDCGPEEQENMYLRNRKGKIIGQTLGHVRMVHARISYK